MGPHAHPARDGSSWPWPFARLSNGLELELNEQAPVTALVDAEITSRGRVISIQAGDRVAIRCEPMGYLSLIKYGRGNTRFHTMLPNAVEGRDFEVGDFTKITLRNEQARMSNEERLDSMRKASAAMEHFYKLI